MHTDCRNDYNMLSMLAEVKRLVHRNKDLTVLSTKVEIYKKKAYSQETYCAVDGLYATGRRI